MQAIKPLNAVLNENYKKQLSTNEYQLILNPHEALFVVFRGVAQRHERTIRAPVRQRFMELIELSERLNDAPREVVLRHVARSMLGNVALALHLPPEYR